MMRRRSWTALLTALAFVIFPFASAHADDRGILTGKVVDQDGHAIPFASVGIPAARTGGLTDSEGLYRVAGLLPGKYTVKVNYIGYDPQTQDVTIEAGKSLTANFRLKQIVVRQEKEVVVTAERPLVEVRSSSTVRSVTSDEIKKLPVQNLEQVLELQTGVTKTNDEIHLRGGRADEVSYIVDGAKTRDLITGKGTAGNISAGSVAEVGVITGGFDAEFGQALSGVVQVRLKEGTSAFHGSVEYQTDHLLGMDSLFNSFNTDGANFELDGPEPITKLLGLNTDSKLTFLTSTRTELTNTYLDNINSRPGPDGSPLRLQPDYRDAFLGTLFSYGHFFSPREDNSWSGLYKLSYKPRTSDKFFVSFNKSLAINQGFGRHLASDIQEDRNTYPWLWSRRWDHAAVDVEDNNTISANWTHVFGTNVVQQIQLSRNVSVLHVGVQGKNNEFKPWQDYVAPNDDIWKSLGRGTADTLKAYDIFHDTGDDSIFEDRYSREVSVGYSLQRATRHHDLKFGIDGNWQVAQFIDIENPWDQDPDTLGSKHDIFAVHPATGALYLRDRVDYEGFVADVGVREDLFVPGREAEAAVLDTANVNLSKTVREGFNSSTFTLLGRKMKGHLSPRISVSHPITERDNFYFNYGQFTQWPAYYYIYSKIGSFSSESFPQIGNVNLDPTISIQYELGGRHQISNTLATNISFYQKDTYGYPTAAFSQRIQGTSLAPFSIYLNSDFSRSRGIELELEKRRARFFSGKITYEYSTIRSKASTPNQLQIIQELGGDTREARVGEEVAYWHRPHQLRGRLAWSMGDEAERPSVLGLFMLPRKFNLSFNMTAQSGRAYTPSRLLVDTLVDRIVNVSSEATGKAYSANAPIEFDADLKMDKTFQVFGRSIRASLTGTNLFDTGRAKFIDPTTGKAYEDGAGLWGRYEITAIQKLRHAEIVSNPSVLSQGRNFRLSVSYDW